MRFILSWLLRIRRSIFLPMLFVWRRVHLQGQAILYRGKVHIGRNVGFGHPVTFQGRGCLVIEDEISLGFQQAGALHAPILLQPREPEAEIILEKGCALMNGCEIIARTSIRVEQRTLIGPHTWQIQPRNNRRKRLDWGKSYHFNGVKIGSNAVVGAGCVVSIDVPEGAIVAGNPMRIIGSVYDRG